MCHFIDKEKINSYRVQETCYCLKKKTTKSMRNDKREHYSTKAISVLKQLNPSLPLCHKYDRISSYY